jgi:tRNA pseudouridine32 synthase/23S rRNA pseudouridine746 synthase
MTTAVDELTVLAATTSPWQLLYQDQDLLVVNKPAMLLTVPGRHPANFDCLISRVQQQFPTAQVVHRLDYDTSGLVLLPLHKKALSELSKQFQARTIEKHYQALVGGELLTEAGHIDLPIAADLARRPLYKICQQSGKPSLTHYQRLAYDAELDLTRVLLKPVTGRSHQLRLHMASIGHAISGDTLYADDSLARRHPRLCLHACWIRFRHPHTGETMEFHAELPF